MRHRWSEVLNDCYDLWILADIEVMTSFQQAHGLPDDLLSAFTRGDTVDVAVAQGVLLPMSGIVNQPYTLLFRGPDDASTFDRPTAELQVDRPGYGLRVTSGALGCITVPYLRQWNVGGLDRLRGAMDRGVRQRIPLEPGFYDVRVRGGLVDDEATFEFVLEQVAEAGWRGGARAEATFVIG